MSKLVILKFSEGSFEQGFPVTLQAGEEDKPMLVQEIGKLPPRREILELYETWYFLYINLGTKSRVLEKRSGQITNISTIESCQQAGKILSKNLNDWLSSQEFIEIKNKLYLYLKKTDSVRILLETDNLQLQRLPWHEWNLFADYRLAEIAIAPPRYEKVEQLIKSGDRIKVLAIFGDSNGINTEEDRKQLLKNIPNNTEIRFLVNPKLNDINQQLWDERYDILFFAGHSETVANTGKIYINSEDSLTIPQLQFALRQAIERGLKIAIFNSCDGLGLAQDLISLHIPQIIVMRERVPDLVAQEFLKYFLQEFYQNNLFYLAVRRARERLQGLEQNYPCASWLPIICQNPAFNPPKWQDLFAIESVHPSTTQHNLINNFISARPRNFLIVLFASIFSTIAVIGARQTGLLEKFELIAFDQLMQIRPEEKVDERLLIVKADEQDIHKYNFPLPDNILAQAIDRLEQYQPTVIGLDIFRDVPREPGYARLAKQFQENSRLIAVCRVPDERVPNNPGIAAPKAITAEGVGFADIILDADHVLRRHLLFLTPQQNTVCNSHNSFSILLAFNYLASKGIRPSLIEETLILDSVDFRPLPYQGRAGGYHDINGEGTQILLNYRATKDVTQIAKTVSLSQVINGSIKKQDVENRIVIIGVTGKTDGGDLIDTPYGKIPGLLVQAHAVSQILSAVLDRPKRALLRFWSLEAEILWIWGWCLVGGILVWRWRSPLFIIITITAATGILTGLCLLLLIQGIWVPLVPSALGLIITSGFVIIYQSYDSH
ncbi:CHASE2 domain-containing protein [Calothrix sp. FACHB-1219]|uniref:CHASE2 domain-containing protein n=1 Tax=unclassified Calothrix TaxID=2619626 RepID=UPI001687E0AD|nr:MULTISPECIES: CHASE2 domain-containing protein [unclassified Calothrix]MBD2207414.1 CHASE2 domain-containing protein [Calothrix sp. FACHB-168]MBD2221990.1 CHASE2 domain-containing protein [Calothrix sp. FACHB-1219]